MIGWTLQQWQAAYRSGDLTPVQAMRKLATTLHDSERALWIHLLDESSLVHQAQSLSDTSLPLYGIPFAVKDNIDVAGMPTTAACPDFAYTPEKDATVVRLLRDAGAIVVGKTNLDQFATGLVGTRSPYGEVPNPFNPDYLSGGSSSGSATAVSLGLVPFSPWAPIPPVPGGCLRPSPIPWASSPLAAPLAPTVLCRPAKHWIASASLPST